MDRVLRNTAPTLTLFNYDGTGALADVAGNITNATVVDSAGVAIAGSPFAVAHASTGVYTLAPGAIAVLDVYSITWNCADGTKRYTEFEVVGAYLFTIADVRAFDPVLASVTKYPAAAIVDVREAVETKFEHPKLTGVAFRPRGGREYVDGSGDDALFLEAVQLRSVVAVSVDGVAFSGADLADLAVYPMGLLRRKTHGIWTMGDRNVAVQYEYGFSSCPADVHRAALVYAQHLLVKSALETPRATAVFTDVGGYRLTVAGRDGPTGLPEVDQVLDQYARGSAAIPGFA